MDEHEVYTRTQNYSGSDRCSRCGDDGQIVVRTRAFPRQIDLQTGKLRPEGGQLEEMGPCPICEKGYRLEFGIGVERGAKGGVLNRQVPNPQGGPWGSDGFWQGRSADDEGS